eukprot:scaffold468260_cov15-Prasinocladus_malaysianus.AAC.1
MPWMLDAVLPSRAGPGTDGSRSGNRTCTKDVSRCFRTSAIRRACLVWGASGRILDRIVRS